MSTRRLIAHLNSRSLFGLCVLVLLLVPQAASAQASMSVEPITWNIIGLDSNDVNVGPNRFPVGARVCNTGSVVLTNVQGTFDWTSTNAYVDLRAGSLNPIPVASIALGACSDFYYEVEVARTAAAYDTTRRYVIAFSSAEGATGRTPTPREVYVERLVSQARNLINNMQYGKTIPTLASVANGGSMTLVVGETYFIRLIASTATQGYEQLEAFINFPNTVFQILSVASAYTSPVGGTGTTLYGDACTWENDPNSPNYRTCLGSGKVGGSIQVTYEVKILSLPSGSVGNPEPLGSLVHDFSGSSFHYNSDFDSSARFAAIVDPTTLTIDKSFSPDPTSAGGVSALTFTITNPNPAVVADVNFTDTFPTSPDAMVVASTPAATTSGCGAATFAPTAGAASISFSNGSVAANSTCTVKVNVTVPTASLTPYSNTSGPLRVGTTSTGDTASDTLIANSTPPPPTPICGIAIAQWAFPSGFSTISPAASSSIVTASAAPGDGVNSTSFTAGTNSWGSNGGIATGATFTSGNEDYLEFAIDTTGYASMELTFQAARKNTPNSPQGIAVYYGTTSLTRDGVAGGGAGETGTVLYAANATALPLGTTAFQSFGGAPTPLVFNTAGGTYYVRIYLFNSGAENSGSDAYVDNVTFSGCIVPEPPTLAKSFAPNPVAVGGSSTLTFTITNPNTYPGTAQTGIAFNDLLPSGLSVTSGSSTQCGGTLTLTAPRTISFSGGSLAVGASCTVSAAVTATTTGPHDNVSGFVSSTNYGVNASTTGIATATLRTIAPPSIEKLFSPNPVLQFESTTLTFSISNPNQDDAISGVAFTDTYPAGILNSSPGLANSSCGGTITWTPDGSSIGFSGGVIPAAGNCTITIQVTAGAGPSYTNTSGSVSHIVNGSPFTSGDTATDTLQVDTARPSLSFTKRVSSSPTGPWLSTLSIPTGAAVYYLFTIENTGDVPLTGISVTDLGPASVSTAGCVFPNPLPVADSLDNGHITTCLVTLDPSTAGTNVNTAYATGSFGGTPYDSVSDTATYQPPVVSFSKRSIEKYFTRDGQEIRYEFTVYNGSLTPLAGPVTISDDLTTNENCPSLTTIGNGDTNFDPGESIVCTASYTTVLADVTAGSIQNTATATVNGVTTASDTVIVERKDANFGHLPTTGAVVYDSNLFDQGGASHLTGGSFLGAVSAIEADGVDAAYGPQAADDGVIWSPGVLWEEGLAADTFGGSIDASVTCPTSNCYLAAWIDWNNDGDFADDGEQISGSTWPVVDGLNTFTFDIPVLTGSGNLLDGAFYVRYRLYEEDPGSTLSPYGAATDSAGTLSTVGEVEDYLYTANAGVLTPVTISYVHARRFGSFTRIEWSTSTESANVGFNIYARKGRELVRVNAELIPSAAIDSLNRIDYSFDAPVDAGHFFIEEVDVLGKARRHGPYEADVEYGSRIEADTIDWASIRKETAAAPLARSTFEKASGPGSAVTMKVRETGFHRVSYESLRAAGIDWTGVQANDISVTLRGAAIPIHVDGGPMFGPGSFVEFHAEALDTIYTDTNVYRLDTTGPRSPRIRVNAGLPGLGHNAPESYTETVLVDRQKAYANYAPGEDAWYDTSMLVFKASKKFKFQFAVNGLADPNASSTMDLVLWGVTAWPQSPDHSVVVFVNGTRVGYKKFDGLVELTLNLEIPRRVLHEGTNTLEVQLPGDTVVDYDLVNLDRFSVTYPRLFNAINGRLRFNAESKVFRVGNLPSSDVVIYRSEGGDWVRQRAFVERGVGNSFVATFAGSNDPARYFVSSAETMHVPELGTARATADLDGDAEYLVIAHPSFIGGLEPLLDARRAQGLTVSVVDVNDLYERYTSGVFDPDAIKQHVAYAVKELGTRFVLLVGGDTYDYRDYLAKESVSFIPSLYASTSETVKFVPVDPRYGDVDGDDVPDVAIGRFPVRTAAELELMIRKTLRYESKDYRRTALFASDEFDGYESFKSISTGLAAGLPAGWASENIHLDDTSVAAAREQLLAGMNRGTSLVTFTGHSGPVEWTFDGLFNTKHAAALTNEGKPFVVVQWGCWNTYYVEPVNNYLVHSFLFSGDRGAAAVLGASTLTDSVSERMLGNLLTPRITTPGMPIGQALVDAKQELAKQHPEMLDVILGWSLMGDPALVVEP